MIIMIIMISVELIDLQALLMVVIGICENFTSQLEGVQIGSKLFYWVQSQCSIIVKSDCDIY